MLNLQLHFLNKSLVKTRLLKAFIYKYKYINIYLLKNSLIEKKNAATTFCLDTNNSALKIKKSSIKDLGANSKNRKFSLSAHCYYAFIPIFHGSVTRQRHQDQR